MYPSLGTERARQDLAEVFAQYDLSSNMSKMIATQVLPVLPVTLAHGTYPVIEVKELMKNPSSAGAAPSGFAARRAPRSAYMRDDLAFTQAAYTTEEHGLEGVVDENEAAHYSSHFEHEATTAEWTLHRLMIQRELRTAAELFSTTRFTGTSSGTYDGQSQAAGSYRETAAANANSPANDVPWSDYANATPIRDVFVSKSKVFDRFGVYPDTLVMSELTWRYLRRNEEIRAQLMAVGAGEQARQRDMTLSAVAQVLDVDKILVGAAVQDTNNANVAAFAAGHIWGDGCLVCRTGGGIRDLTLGHTLHWTADGSRLPAMVEDYREPQTRSQIIRVRHQDRQLVKYDIGEFITDTL